MPTYRDYRTPFGVIHYKPTACRDDYPNMVTYDQGAGHTSLTLQRAAMRAFWAAQVRYARSCGWSKARLRRNPKGRPIYVLPGTNRTCATQARLYRSDPDRYAHPNVTGHTRGIAIDVSQAQPNLVKVDRALRAEGWTQVRSDEPWHWSFGVTV